MRTLPRSSGVHTSNTAGCESSPRCDHTHTGARTQATTSGLAANNSLPNRRIALSRGLPAQDVTEPLAFFSQLFVQILTFVYFMWTAKDFSNEALRKRAFDKHVRRMLRRLGKAA